jgi:hypothetical protein
MIALALALVPATVPAAPPQDPDPPAIVVDGRRWEPSWHRSDFVPLAGDPDRPTAGDPVRFGQYWLTLPAGRELRVVDSAAPGGKLEIDIDGSRSLAAVHGRTLLRLDAEERSALRGVWVTRWSDEVGRALVDLGPDAVVRIGSECAIEDSRQFPPLPASLRHLVVDLDRGEGFGDWSAAARLTGLRTLRVARPWAWTSTIDLRPFAAASELGALELGEAPTVGAEVVAGFRALRVLRWKASPLEDLEALRELTELRVLVLRRGRHRSLAPLAALPQLHTVETRSSPVDDLPPGGFRALRVLDVQDTAVPPEAVRTFRRQHPDCEVLAGPDPEQLRAALATVDRLVVREGGTCHLSGDERVLAEVTDAAKIGAVAAWLAVVPGQRSFHCMCCGNPTLIFHAGDRVAATIGFHHGRSIRWADGPWTSDALLDGAGAAALAAWLATVGAPGPQNEVDGAEAQLAAAAAIRRLRLAAVGAATLEAIEDGAGGALAAGALGLVDALLLLGCHEGAWDAPDPLDRALGAALRARLDDLDRDDAVATAVDPRVARGLAALLFAPDLDRSPARTDAPLLRRAATAGLRHPQPFNRARTVQVLRDLDGDQARDLLREALAGEHPPREVPAEALVAPAGMVLVMPSDPVLDQRSASTRTLAGLALVARGDAESHDAIRAWAAEAGERERRLLTAALGAR